MCLEYKQIEVYLHYYAGKFQSKYFEHDELINEAWMVVYKLDNIRFASQGIRWAMLHYIQIERAKAHKGNSKAVLCSIEKEMGIGILLKDIFAHPKNYLQTTEDKDLISGILRNANLNMRDRILLDVLFYRGWTQVKIAKLRGCTRQAISLHLDRIIQKLTRVATKVA